MKFRTIYRKTYRELTRSSLKRAWEERNFVALHRYDPEIDEIITHVIDIPYGKWHELADMLEWISANGHRAWAYEDIDTKHRFHFLDLKDATLFRLRF